MENIKCRNCAYFRRLKKDFIQGKGYSESNCCLVLSDDKDGFVLETSENAFCEMFTEVHNDR